MKILHTADWHIGKVVNGFSMLDDQAYVLKQIVKIIQEEKPDVVVIAGDLYDRSIPPVGAVRVFNQILQEIVWQNQTKVIAVAGNHDSNERLEFASELLKESGLFLIGCLKNPPERIVVEDAHGEVHFYPIPYMDPLVVAEIYADETVRTHEDAMKRVIDEIAKSFDSNVRNVAIAHGYFSMMKTDAKERFEHTELQISASEKRLAIGGSDLVSSKYFHAFDYTALGHLHRHQQVGSPKMKYSGSPLKYSFSEVNHKKGVAIIELDAHGNVEERFILLKPIRDFRIIRGYLDELIQNVDVQTSSDYVRAELLDKGELIGSMAKLQSAYPNAMELVRVESTQVLNLNQEKLQVEGKTPTDLYRSFYLAVTGEVAREKQIQWIETMVHTLEKGKREI